MHFDLSVYFILDPSVCRFRSVTKVAREAVRGGVTMLQLRNKVDPLDMVDEQARALMGVLEGTGVPLIINDHVELACKVGADGVHVGQGDRDVASAREMMGEDKIVGLTAFNQMHYDAIDVDKVDYVGTGPIYPTMTKPDKPVMGLDGFAELVQVAPVPVIGIGGINAENSSDVIRAGAQGVAMMRAISMADDIEGAAKSIVEAVALGRCDAT